MVVSGTKSESRTCKMPRLNLDRVAHLQQGASRALARCPASTSESLRLKAALQRASCLTADPADSMDAVSATEELQEGAECLTVDAVEKKSASSIVHDVLTSDLLLKVWAFLGQEHIFQAIQVCHRWRNLSSGLDESESSEDGQLTGAVNWPAFRHLGILRQKKHSMVVKCQSRASGKVLVVKRIQTRVCPSTGESQDQHQDQGFPVRYLREVALLRAADHPNIMRLHKIFYYQDKLNLFSEFVGQNVEDYIAQQAEEAYQIGTPQHRVMMDTCRLFVRQIIEGVCYCHSVGIMLRDMKPRNVMMSMHDPTKVKLTGLALGRFASLPAEALTREVVTQCYRAPEILLGGATPVYSVPVDMWSVGCTMAEIASGRTLFEGDSEIGQLFTIFRVLGTPNEESWPGVSLLPDFLSQAPLSLPPPLSLSLPPPHPFPLSLSLSHQMHG